MSADVSRSGPSPESYRDRIAGLEQLLRRYQTSYYNGEAEVSDAEFDALWDQLRGIDPSNAIFTQVGADSLDGFPKARHLIPMGSQEKAANPDQFLAWIAKQTSSHFIVQHKLDGASLELQYEKGTLVRAVTRGDGLIGDEITRNARKMQGCVADLGVEFSGGVRGEVIMSHSVWLERYSDKANCRNAANGLMRRKDGDGAEHLCLICYDVASLDPGEDRALFGDENAKIAWLSARGFRTAACRELCTGEEIIAFREEISKQRSGLDWDIDGLVVKCFESDPEDLRRSRPERQIAFKFELEEAVSILRAVEWSESGATYTPIGIIDPVRIAGTTVQRANLNNPAMIRTMGLRLFSSVVVVKRGEIIPKIERLAPEPVDADIPMEEILQPTVCGTCGTALVDAGTRLYCPNASCPKRLHHRIEKWVSVLDIREFGEQLLRRLYEAGRLSSVSDLYTITVEELSSMDRMGDLSAAKVVRHLRSERELSLAAFVAGFDLEGVGETIMEKVVQAGFDTLDKLRLATVDELSAVYGLGSITARTIVDGLVEVASDMDGVLSAGPIRIAPPLAAGEAPLRGFSFCFTGELASMKRNAAEARIKALGGLPKSSVTADLSFLVTNDPDSGSSKNEKARKLGIRILDEAAFLALLESPETAGQEAGLEAIAVADGGPLAAAPTTNAATVPKNSRIPARAPVQGDLF